MAILQKQFLGGHHLSMNLCLSVCMFIRSSVRPSFRLSVCPSVLKIVPFPCAFLHPSRTWTPGHWDTGTPGYWETGTPGNCDTLTMGHLDGTLGDRDTRTPGYKDISAKKLGMFSSCLHKILKKDHDHIFRCSARA